MKDGERAAIKAARGGIEPRTLAGGVKRRSGTKFVMELKGREKFVAMIEYKGQVIVASTKSLYSLTEGKVKKIPIVQESKGNV